MFLAAALVALLACAPAGYAAEPATLEYNVQLPSARDSPLGIDGVRGGDVLTVDQSGVAGETPSTVQSPLESAADALVNAPPALALLVLLAAGAGLALRAGPRPGPG
jgi:hypothetical protein